MAERRRLVKLGDNKPRSIVEDPLTVLVYKQSDNHYVAAIFYVWQTFDAETDDISAIIPEAQVIEGRSVDDAYRSALDWIEKNISNFEELIDPRHA